MSSGFKMDVWYVAGNAGGVRGMVAVGMGVSVGAGVSVGMLICATAVSKAAVMMMLGSMVAGAGWQDANSMVNKLQVRKRCEILDP